MTDKTLSSIRAMTDRNTNDDDDYDNNNDNNNNNNSNNQGRYIYGDTAGAFDYLRENDTWKGAPGAEDQVAIANAQRERPAVNALQLISTSNTMKGLPHGLPLRVETFARPRPYTGPSAEVVLAMRQQNLSAGQYHFYEEPLMLVEGQMQYCFDEKGRAYLDGYSNVAHVGHCHPVHVRAIQQASGEILSNTRYLHPNIVEFTRRIKEKLPSHLSVVYLVNSGSEANDLAMRLARCHTKRSKIACLSGAYHGTTLSCSGVSTSLSVGTEEGGTDFPYASKDVVILPVADPYRGRFKGTDPDAGKRYVQWSREIIQDKYEESDIAGFIAEAIQGVAGQIVYPPGYLKRMFDYIKRIGGVCIMDEVQTGFGRCGSHFWAFEAQGASPDILVLGKPIGNGFPLGAVVCTREISKSFDASKYFNTFGGNPLACAAGLAVLNILERDNMQQNALRVGMHFIRGLQALQRRHKLIGDVRGVGTFLGIEFVRDRDTLEPATEETKHIMEQCRKYGVLVGKGGVHNNVIRFKPPLCFTTENAEVACAILDRVLADLPRKFKAPSKQDGNNGNFFFNNGATILLEDDTQQKEDGEGGVFPRNSYVYSGSSVSLTKDVPASSYDKFGGYDSASDSKSNKTTYTTSRAIITQSTSSKGGYRSYDDDSDFDLGGIKNFNFKQNNQTSGRIPSNSANTATTLRDCVRRSLNQTEEVTSSTFSSPNNNNNNNKKSQQQSGYNWQTFNSHNPTNNNNNNNSSNSETSSLIEAVRRSLQTGKKNNNNAGYQVNAEPSRSALRHNNHHDSNDTPRVSFSSQQQLRQQYNNNGGAGNNTHNNFQSGLRRLREGEYDAFMGGSSSGFKLPQ